MARESKSATLDKMLKVVQAVNALSPGDPVLDGEPVELARFARLVGMDPKECLRIVEKIDYGCGDALPAAWIEYDEQTGCIVPHRLCFASQGLMRLSHSEAFALLVTLRSSGADADGTLAATVRGALPELDLARFDTVAAGADMPQGSLERVADAVARREVLSIEYRDARGACSTRTVEPLEVWYDSAAGAWSFSAWCRTRDEVRTFRLDRLRAVPQPTGEVFPERQTALGGAAVDMARGVTAVLAVHDPKAVARTSWPELEELQDPTDDQLAHLRPPELAQGGYIAQIPWIPGSFWLVQAIVSTLGGVEAVSPARLREEVRDLAGQLLVRLGESGDGSSL